jgi:hypothetical protein
MAFVTPDDNEPAIACIHILATWVRTRLFGVDTIHPISTSVCTGGSLRLAPVCFQYLFQKISQATFSARDMSYTIPGLKYCECITL